MLNRYEIKGMSLEYVLDWINPKFFRKPFLFKDLLSIYRYIYILISSYLIPWLSFSYLFCFCAHVYSCSRVCMENFHIQYANLTLQFSYNFLQFSFPFHYRRRLVAGRKAKLTPRFDGRHENHWCTAQRPRDGAAQYTGTRGWHPWSDHCANGTATQLGAIGGHTRGTGSSCLEWQNAVLSQHYRVLCGPGQHLAFSLSVSTEWWR